MHSTTRVIGRTDARMTLWALYINISIAALAFMAITGPWLWLLSRRRLWWARFTLAAGVAVVGALWVAIR